MGSPYTSVTVNNYNSNPPSDDGSQNSSNQITWAKHKTKIGDPLKTAIEAVNTNVSAAIAAIAGGITATGVDYTVLASDQGKTIKVTASGVTISTPAAATVGSPFRFNVVNESSGDITLDGNASETIDGALTVTIPAGRGLSVETDGSNWFTRGQNWPEVIVRPVPMFAPTGRLTITSGAPVLTSDTSAQGTVYYSPYVGGAIMLYDGSNWKAYSYSELSQALSDNTKSPAAALASNLYDMFVWVDGTTMRCTRGPAWTSSTGRGTGAGTTELTRVNGVLMNANNISNGPAAQRGVYVGTIATDGSTQLNMQFNPSPAAGGNGNRIDVFNAYNSKLVTARSKDSTNTWAGSASWGPANVGGTGSGLNNRITAVFGLNEDAIVATYAAVAIMDNGGPAFVGVGLDSTSAFSGFPGALTRSSFTSEEIGFIAQYSGLPGLGQHYVQALENAAGNSVTFCGDNNAPTNIQMALTLQLRI